jgi:hypothetical protein
LQCKNAIKNSPVACIGYYVDLLQNLRGLLKAFRFQLYVPKTQTSSNAKRGIFTVQDFIYDAESDRYACRAGEFLTTGKVRSDRRDNIDHYHNLTACLTCGLRPQCTPDKVKRQPACE